jgi:hypothetical protein
MQPFFINVVSNSDIWMFMSSNGALTAGRKDAGLAIFPYETDDRLHLSTNSGPKTLVRLPDGKIWEPFAQSYDNPFIFKRSLYKRLTGDAVIFEEINETLGLVFSYRWETSEKYGVVRTACITNNNEENISLTILDGAENIIPFGITKGLADSSSCLTDAYKVSERPHKNLAVYSLTSTIVDGTEPLEIMHANTAWYIGDEAQAFLLSSKQIPAFAAGKPIKDEILAQGRKGAFFTEQEIVLTPAASKSWKMVFDARKPHGDIADLIKELESIPKMEMQARLEADIIKGTAELKQIVAVSDGMQCTADKRADVRHYMNVLYNNMRGGVFLDGYTYDPVLFMQFISTRNKSLLERHKDFFDTLPANSITLYKKAFDYKDLDIIRLCLEFLPLTFSRRHGDPSRPWNRFNIQIKNENGKHLYHYEGNWRDIFQNWEAMALSFPGYITPIIVKFLNASTADGFNPYRITQDGIDWEVPEPDNPFSGYGYWGDHQIVYLNRLLEWAYAYTPNELASLKQHDIFVYANVPYEIKPYDALINNAKDTIAFIKEKHNKLMKRTEEQGSDGKLLLDANGIIHVGLAEKLLVPVLAKLSNLVPGGGIWMNTQRPEWNDANNAIVGNGLSMVTVYQLYRHIVFIKKIITAQPFLISNEVAGWLNEITGILTDYAALAPRAYIDRAGESFSAYRKKIYANGLNGKRMVNACDIQKFFDAALNALDKTIQANKRKDGMYHGYNILTLTENNLEISPLFLMLEAQTAILGSGILNPDEALALVQVMENSELMSNEHGAFFLYPKKQLKSFMQRNIIPPDMAEKINLDDGFVYKDAGGNYRFHNRIRQFSDLNTTNKEWAGIYEAVFAHRQFTGRSGIMYKYEGIGSIYWHQNAKFLLSFGEAMNRRDAAHKDAYYRLRMGFGFNKEPSVWGAFPLEPYSHTPYGMPAQQPGMTGQVKEDILTRNAELGICVKNGCLFFEPSLLRATDFLTELEMFMGIDLTSGSLAFTVCGVPVVYKLFHKKEIIITMRSGEKINIHDSLALDEKLSRSLFERDGLIKQIEVRFER